MLVQKKNFEDFYNDLRNQFPKMKELATWKKYDWSLSGCENSLIMSEISVELAVWASNNQLDETQRLLDFIESYFQEGDASLTSIMNTDFLVTIMEVEHKPTRELIKKMMKPVTSKYYMELLNLYREAN